MNKRYLSILILVGILFLTTSSFSVEYKRIVSQQKQQLNLIRSADECTTPQIYEFIRKFMIPVKDVDGVIHNQLSRSNLSNVQAADKVILYAITYKSEFLNQNQSVKYQTPLKATVVNDQTRFTFNYQVNLTEGIPTKVHQFNGTTTLDNVKFTYTKELNPQTGVFKFSNVAITIDATKMKSSFLPTPNGNQTKKLENATKGANNSLYASFKNFLSVQQFTTFLQSNAKKSALSRTYDSNPFKYDFYSYITNIDVSTLNVVLTDRTDGDDKDLINGISAKLQSPGKYCSSYVPDANNTSPLMFISTEFIQNFIDFSIVNYKNWSDIQINKQSSRSQLLQFRLLDLEYIVDGLLEGQLAPYYQNQIVFRCKAWKNVQTSFDTDNQVLLQGIDWQCYAFVQNVNGKQVKVMDFQPRIKHTIDFKISSAYLYAGMNKLEYVDCVFNAIDGKYTVSDKRVAQKYIETIFNQYRTPAVLGTFFKLPQNSRTVEFGQNNTGLWIS